MDYVIETRDLYQQFRAVQAVSGLNLRIARNQVTGFLGRNGAGKSTTIKMLLGMTHPTSGSGRCLRTSHATWLKMSGTDVEDAQAQLRHSRGSTTLEIYQQFVPESPRRAVDRLSQLAPIGTKTTDPETAKLLTTREI